jgi:hypothetical protein
MDVHQTFLEAFNDMRVLSSLGRNRSSKYGVHQLTALKQLDILFDIGCSARAFPLYDDDVKNHDFVVGLLGGDWNKVSFIDLSDAKTIVRDWFITSGFYDISKEKPKVWSPSEAFAEE